MEFDRGWQEAIHDQSDSVSLLIQVHDEDMEDVQVDEALDLEAFWLNDRDALTAILLHESRVHGELRFDGGEQHD